jgi:hypothetical protein
VHTACTGKCGTPYSVSISLQTLQTGLVAVLVMPSTCTAHETIMQCSSSGSPRLASAAPLPSSLRGEYLHALAISDVTSVQKTLPKRELFRDHMQLGWTIKLASNFACTVVIHNSRTSGGIGLQQKC